MNGKKEGRWKERDEIGYYRNGKQDGVWKEYHYRSRHLNWIRQYKDGIPVGVWEQYSNPDMDPSGKKYIMFRRNYDTDPYGN